MFVEPDLRQKVTIYTRWIDEAAQTVKIIRRLLTNCRVTNTAGAIYQKTGTMPQNTRVIRVFKDDNYKYIPYNEWFKLSESELVVYWSADFIASTSTVRMSSLIVDRDEPYEFGSYPIVNGICTAATTAENLKLTDKNNYILGLARLRFDPEDKTNTATEREAHILLNSRPSDL